MSQPISPRKLDANRRNALRSTGPTTPAGKARVRFNALTHGLLAKEVVLPGEDRAEFEGLVARLSDHYSPVGPIQEMLVEQIAVAYWRGARAVRAERGEVTLGLAALDAPSSAAQRHTRLAERLEEARKRLDEPGPFEISAELCAVVGLDEKQIRARIKDLTEAETRETLRSVLEQLKTEQLEAARKAERAEAPLRDAKRAQQSLAEGMWKFLRYEAAHNRTLERTLDRLEQLQRRRREAPMRTAGEGPTPA